MPYSCTQIAACASEASFQPTFLLPSLPLPLMLLAFPGCSYNSFLASTCLMQISNLHDAPFRVWSYEQCVNDQETEGMQVKYTFWRVCASSSRRDWLRGQDTPWMRLLPFIRPSCRKKLKFLSTTIPLFSLPQCGTSYLMLPLPWQTSLLNGMNQN